METKIRCDKCNGTGRVKLSYSQIVYCDEHFLEIIEKRTRKELRESSITPKGEYEIYKEESNEYKLAKYFLDKVFKGRLNIKEVKETNPETIRPTSLDREAEEFLKSFLEDKEYKPKGIPFMRSILEEEIKEVCRILNMKYKERERMKELDSFEEKYPGTKFSLLKSLKELESENPSEIEEKNK